jgi:ketosteroid isomerase-like protein
MDPSADEAAVMAVLDGVAAAHAARDARRIVSHYVDDALVYDLAPPLGRRGMDEARVAGWLATWDGPVAIAGRDTEITVSGDLAVATGLARMRGAISGEAVEVWMRETVVLRRTGDGWRIVHDHSSVPFHMDGSFRAATDLSPPEAPGCAAAHLEVRP